VEPFVESFLPLFVAINLPGIVPIFLGLTDGFSVGQRRRLAFQALLTAGAVSVVILFAGQLIFRVMGITVNDLRVGGGLILLTLSIADLLFGDYRRRDPTADGNPGDSAATVGIVPIGIPLIVGPAAITTILVSQQSHGYLPTLSSLVANLAIVFAGLAAGPYLIGLTGPAVAKAVAKVASLFLAAIAVAMIRAGVVGFLAGAGPV
jgi:multiple antibiotic resistance protein